MSDQNKTLYERLGGYDAIVAVANDLLPRLQNDPQLGRFWAHRGEDGVKREKQLLIDFLCENAGGPMYYRGRRHASIVARKQSMATPKLDAADQYRKCGPRTFWRFIRW